MYVVYNKPRAAYSTGALMALAGIGWYLWGARHAHVLLALIIVNVHYWHACAELN